MTRLARVLPCLLLAITSRPAQSFSGGARKMSMGGGHPLIERELRPAIAVSLRLNRLP